jgi:hypothetical protein
MTCKISPYLRTTKIVADTQQITMEILKQVPCGSCIKQVVL